MTTDATAPVKDQPHPFQPTPEVPLAYGRAGATLPELDGSILGKQDTSTCALCNSPRSAAIHVEGKEEADASPIHWG